MSLSRSDLPSLLGLPEDASAVAIRSRVSRIASGKPEMGSSPAKRAALFEALGLGPGAGDIAARRVVESMLRPSRVLSYSRIPRID